ncbi:hypothetical protein D3C81_1710420 [compost metagenome]
MRADIADARTRYIADIQSCIEQFVGQDHHLEAYVKPFHIGGRICLGVTELLRLYDGIVERQAVFHLAEHIVGSAVQDAFEALYVGTRQGLFG